MLNEESLRLCAQLDRETGAEAGVSVKEMAKFGRSLNAAKAKRAAPAKKRRLGGLFDWLGGAVSKVAKTATKVAGTIGVPLPLDKDIALLEGRKRELSSLSKQMEQIQANAVKRLLSRKTARTDLMAQNLQKTSNQAKFELQAAIKALDQAQAAAQQAKRDIAGGKFPAEATGVYLIRKKQSEVQYASAKKRGEAARASWVNAESDLAKEGVPSVRDYAQAVGSTASAFASKTGSALSQVGDTAEEVVKQVGSGAKAVTPVLKYWPWALGAAAALYAVSIIPKPQPSSK